jgi:DNA-binding NarL/FixJ family response regulator
MMVVVGKGKIRVMIVDDHPLFRQGLRQAIGGDSRFEVVGEADHGQTALDRIPELRPDVAVLDVNLPGLTGLEVAAALRAKKFRVSIVILTMLKDEQAFNKALNLGIHGYVLKENAAEEILNCIAAVSRNEAYVSPSLTDFLLRRRSRAESLASHKPGLDDLTVAEKRILKRRPRQNDQGNRRRTVHQPAHRRIASGQHLRKTRTHRRQPPVAIRPGKSRRAQSIALIALGFLRIGDAKRWIAQENTRAFRSATRFHPLPWGGWHR